ncbi:DUF2156 domain-containing protein [Candidatus Omnitrophota bacterium]
MKPLALQDKKLFDSFLTAQHHQLSYFSFASIFIWKDSFIISWELIDEHLCIFARDGLGCFMLLPPVGPQVTDTILNACFGIMAEHSSNGSIARIENIESDEIDLYTALGLSCVPKDPEYIYRSQDLVQLKGNDYKKKRSAYNYCIKHYKCSMEEFSDQHRDDCFALHECWVAQRKAACSDTIAQAMLEDSVGTTQVALRWHRELDLEGRVVMVHNEVKGYSFGFPLNRDTFCILFEVADHAIKGLAQYLFREFSREKQTFRYINAMDDSQIAGLKNVKESYRPHRLESAYIATRK